MKRDMDVIRMLLIQQETGEAPPELANYPHDLLVYNVALMKDAGLVEAAIADGPDGTPVGAVIIRLTWAGHDSSTPRAMIRCGAQQKKRS